MIRYLIVLLILLLLIGCSESPPKSDVVQQRQQEAMSQESNAIVGMPGITKFTEKKIMRRIYEMRDTDLLTFTYIRNTMTNELTHVCDSMGFGLPYGVQFSNPAKLVPQVGGNGAYAILPQSEPNGLWMPPSAEGTWVVCITPIKGEFDVIYVEDRIISSPVKLKATGTYQIAVHQPIQHIAAGVQ